MELSGAGALIAIAPVRALRLMSARYHAARAIGNHTRLPLVEFGRVLVESTAKNVRCNRAVSINLYQLIDETYRGASGLVIQKVIQTDSQ